MKKNLFLTILFITLISTVLTSCSSASNEDKIPKSNKKNRVLTAEEAESQKNQYVEWMKREDRLKEGFSSGVTLPVEEYIGLGVLLGCSVPVPGTLPENLSPGDNLQVAILKFLPNSPARACGFEEGDEITSNRNRLHPEGTGSAYREGIKKESPRKQFRALRTPHRSAEAAGRCQGRSGLLHFQQQHPPGHVPAGST